MATIRKIANIRLNEKDFNAYNTQRALDNIVNNLNLALQQIADNASGGSALPTAETAIAETPSGVVNGSNTVFTTSELPLAPAEMVLTLDGLTQRYGIDYTVVDSTITFAAAPATGTEIYVQYNSSIAQGSVLFNEVSGTDVYNVCPDPVAFGDSDSFIMPASPFSSGASNSPSRNIIRCRPIPLGKFTTITSLGYVLSTGQVGGKCRIGLYELDASGYPTSLVYDSGEFLQTAAEQGRNLRTGLSIPISPTKAYGFAYLGGHTGTAPSMIVHSTSAQPYVLRVQAASVSIAVASNYGWGWSVAYTYGALPATFPAGATSNAISRDAFVVPLIQATA